MLTREICTDVEIKGAPKRIWKALTTFSRYPLWNPFLRISGEERVGARLKINIVRAGHKPLTFGAIITRMEENHELIWRDRPRIPGVFKGERVFTLEVVDSRTTRLIHCQRYSGLLAPLLRRGLNNLLPLLEATNLVLKAHIEKG